MMEISGAEQYNNDAKNDKEKEIQFPKEQNPKIDTKKKNKIFTGQKEEKIKNEKNENEKKIQLKINSNPTIDSEFHKTTAIEHPEVPPNLVFETKKSVCKIIGKYNGQTMMGSGFFMKINDSKNYLITANYVINKNDENENIEIEIHNKEKFALNLKNRQIEYFPTEEISLIEIKNSDELYNHIKFLYYDLNYTLGYEIYKNGFVFTIGYPRGREPTCSSGKIINIKGFEFEHNIQTAPGSAGCPIILLNENINEIRVIGLHKGKLAEKKLGIGSFIAEIFKKEIDKIKK